MKELLRLCKQVYHRRGLILSLAKADFKKRFVGSYFGVAWMFVQPIVTVLIYFAIFQLGFKSVPPVPNAPYVVWLVPAIVVWFYFNESLGAGTNCLQEYDYLVKKVVFDVEILPIIKLVSCAMVHAVFILIMIGMYFAFGRLPMLTWIQIVYYSFAMSVLILAFSYITSAINVFFKDMYQIISVALQFGMWFTPIMWDPTTFKNFPSWLYKIIKLNPVYYITTGYRDSMLSGNWFWERPMLSVYFWIFTLSLLIFGLKVFKKLRPHFSDVL